MSVRSDHPVDLVAAFCDAHPEVAFAEVSRYRYAPQTVTDRRKILQLDARFLRDEWERLTQGLAAGEELAFHSRVHLLGRLRPRTAHLALVDLKGTPDERSQARVASALHEFGSGSVAFFSSGRSLHAYGFVLLSENDWIRLMGRLLLVNPPDGPEVVDTRWIGHRLLAGYGALRWTRNTDAYLSPPRLVRLEGRMQTESTDITLGSNLFSVGNAAGTGDSPTG